MRGSRGSALGKVALPPVGGKVNFEYFAWLSQVRCCGSRGLSLLVCVKFGAEQSILDRCGVSCNVRELIECLFHRMCEVMCEMKVGPEEVRVTNLTVVRCGYVI